MATPFVFTFVGADQPGLVEQLSQTVAEHGGNWLESRMSELAGQFAGIVKVEVSQAQAAAVQAFLKDRGVVLREPSVVAIRSSTRTRSRRSSTSRCSSASRWLETIRAGSGDWSKPCCA